MKATKKVIHHLTKCYCVAPLRYNKEDCFIVAAEKQDACLLFNQDGECIDTIWEGPGGTMSIVQVPGTNGQFLATQKFYSPNDSKESKIVIVTPKDGKWEIKTLIELPFTHRFDIIQRNGISYLIACTIKSGHEHKDDWSMPGKVYAAALTESIEAYGEDHPLKMEVIKEGLLKNHGYYKVNENGVDTAIISAEEGVFCFVPPSEKDGQWEISQILDKPASDAVLLDIDNDGEKELAVLAPFHGDDIVIYKKKDGAFQEVYKYGEKAEFVHAIYGGPLAGEKAFVVGHRKGERNLLAFTYDKGTGSYQVDVLDRDCGSANVLHFVKDGVDYLVGANREIDEIAMYKIEK